MKRTFEDFAVTTGIDAFAVCLAVALVVGAIFGPAVTSNCQGRKAVAVPAGIEPEADKPQAADPP
jgi:hypothetical protein